MKINGRTFLTKNDLSQWVDIAVKAYDIVGHFG